MSSYFLSPIKKKQYILLAVDISIILMALWISRSMIQGELITAGYSHRALFFTALIVMNYTFSLYVFSLYNLSPTVETHRSRASILGALTVGFLATLLLNATTAFYHPKSILVLQFIILVGSMYAWRLLFLRIFINHGIPLRAVVLGEKYRLERFINDFEAYFSSGYEIIGVYCKTSMESNAKLECINEKSSYTLEQLLFEKSHDLILYDAEHQYFNQSDVETIIKAKFAGKAIYDIRQFFQEMTGKTPIDIIHGNWLILTAYIQGRENRLYFRIKRLTDILLSLFLMILLSPLIILIACSLKLSSLNRALYVQERLCTHRNTFKCIKFCTMLAETDSEQKRPQWATKEPNRITPLGRILRKTRLDELPQLWNILKGEMSFVGPRPIRKHFANELAKEIPFYNLRFMVKPGLSGWAQVKLGYADSFESQREKFAYELFYLQNMSFLLDTIIILKTIQKVLRGEGA